VAGEALVLAVFPALLALAGGWDLASYTIPNWLQGLLIAAFVAFAFALGLSPAAAGSHVLTALLGLAAGFALFALGFIGGGDAKLFACVLLWFGFHDALVFVLAASLFGGALTLSLLTLRGLPLPAVLAHQSWIERLHDSKAGVPYGVALAAGAVAVLPQTEIFRLAAGA
jgi:prepilin peptidase CpaA